MSDAILEVNQNQSLSLPYYKSLLPKSINNEINLSKKSSNRCSSLYRQRLERIKTNCELIRQRRRLLSPIVPIELRPSLFQQRYYQSGSLKSLSVKNSHWRSTNFLRLSDEYLYKCKYAIYSSTKQYFKQNEFYHFLRNLFSCSSLTNEYNNDSHMCHLCNYKFSSKDTFDLHLNRRSVSIEYQCLSCQSLIRTMNPCQAYYHLLLHDHNNPNELCIEHLNINYDWDNCSVSY